ncbi:hypothetical protein, partial [Methyloversatilis sp.]|uniref:hypothetical protein n=1 Tax=Methyloversatilis sp. TaxID=2569862 RepID=UPI0027362B6C
EGCTGKGCDQAGSEAGCEARCEEGCAGEGCGQAGSEARSEEGCPGEGCGQAGSEARSEEGCPGEGCGQTGSEARSEESRTREGCRQAGGKAGSEEGRTGKGCGQARREAGSEEGCTGEGCGQAGNEARCEEGGRTRCDQGRFEVVRPGACTGCTRCCHAVDCCHTGYQVVVESGCCMAIPDGLASVLSDFCSRGGLRASTIFCPFSCLFLLHNRHASAPADISFNEASLDETPLNQHYRCRVAWSPLRMSVHHDNVIRCFNVVRQRPALIRLSRCSGISPCRESCDRKAPARVLTARHGNDP